MTDGALSFLQLNGFGHITGQDRLQGGLTSTVLRLSFSSGRSAIYKESINAKPDMYACEADGLKELAQPGAPRVPEVYSFDDDHFLIEDLGLQDDPTETFWMEFGRRLGALHNVRADRHGYHRSNYLGTMLLDNTWCDDGREFFAKTRVLTFLSWPKNEAVLTAEDRKAVERIAERLPDLIPPQGPSLTHGDLWTGNMLMAPGGVPALIDPAVYYGMPEADLALLPSFNNIPPSFWDAYCEVHPLEPGWRDRLELLSIRDPLCMIAEYGDIYDGYARLKRTIDKYS